MVMTRTLYRPKSIGLLTKVDVLYSLLDAKTRPRATRFLTDDRETCFAAACLHAQN